MCSDCKGPDLYMDYGLSLEELLVLADKHLQEFHKE